MRLDALLRPRSVAVVGASERASAGRTLIEALDRIGFPGEVYPINPKYETIFGRRCYPSVAELPRGVDVLAFCVSHARVLENMAPAAEACSSRARTYMPGSSAPCGLGTSTRKAIWPEAGSTDRSENSSLPG